MPLSQLSMVILWSQCSRRAVSIPCEQTPALRVGTGSWSCLQQTTFSARTEQTGSECSRRPTADSIGLRHRSADSWQTVHRNDSKSQQCNCDIGSQHWSSHVTASLYNNNPFTFSKGEAVKILLASVSSGIHAMWPIFVNIVNANNNKMVSEWALQHSIGYLGDGFTGQKTQPTVSKYWRNKRYKN